MYRESQESEDSEVPKHRRRLSKDDVIQLMRLGVSAIGQVTVGAHVIPQGF